MDEPRPRQPTLTRRLLAPAVVAVAALAVVGVLVVLLTDDGGPDGADGTAGGADPGIAHVHGLGIDPADGALMVATHSGLFRIDEGRGGAVSRVGDSFQDTMGFTVAGPNHYLGSGHPDLAGFEAGQPGLLGLIESTDGGETWQPLSLAGEADFHGLAVVDETLYGWDSTSGGLMATTDHRSWETRSTVDLLGFAVDPSDADHVLLGSPTGLMKSTDGGRTWTSAEGPDLVSLSWNADAGLWGIDAGGQVWQGGEPGWEPAGRLAGEPHAFLATSDAFYTASADADGITTIYGSPDGEKWEPIFRDDG